MVELILVPPASEVSDLCFENVWTQMDDKASSVHYNPIKKTPKKMAVSLPFVSKKNKSMEYKEVASECERNNFFCAFIRASYSGSVGGACINNYSFFF